jgi:hypothetical protein
MNQTILSGGCRGRRNPYGHCPLGEAQARVRVATPKSRTRDNSRRLPRLRVGLVAGGSTPVASRPPSTLRRCRSFTSTDHLGVYPCAAIFLASRPATIGSCRERSGLPKVVINRLSVASFLVNQKVP